MQSLSKNPLEIMIKLPVKVISLIILVSCQEVFGQSHRGHARSFGSWFGGVQKAGSSFLNNVKGSVMEAGEVAKIIAEDAKDAFSTVATSSIDDFIPKIEDEPNVQYDRVQDHHPAAAYKRTAPIQYFTPRQSYYSGVVSGMLRMVGVDEHKLGLMAINVLVYLAEFLAKNLLGMPSELENEIPEYRSIMNHEGMLSAMWRLAQNANERSERTKEQFFDPDLPEKIIDGLPDRYLGADLGCVQLFLCKMKPAFWSIQDSTKQYDGISISRSITNNFNRWLDVVYHDLPTLNQLTRSGRDCNAKYPTCDLISTFF